MWVSMPGNVDRFFDAMEGASGTAKMAFRNACFAVKVPYTLMYRYVDGKVELRERYESFLRAKADLLVQEALDDVEGAVDRDSAASAKVKAETKLKVASKWDQERYGEKISVEKSVSVSVDAGLLTDMGQLLKLAKKEPRVLEQEVPALAAPEEN